MSGNFLKMVFLLTDGEWSFCKGCVSSTIKLVDIPWRLCISNKVWMIIPWGCCLAKVYDSCGYENDNDNDNDNDNILFDHNIQFIQQIYNNL